GGRGRGVGTPRVVHGHRDVQERPRRSRSGGRGGGRRLHGGDGLPVSRAGPAPWKALRTVAYPARCREGRGGARRVARPGRGGNDANGGGILPSWRRQVG